VTLDDQNRCDQAGQAAEEYAPKPKGSSLTYGIVGVALAAVLIYAVGGFYGFDALRYPALVIAILAVAFLGSVMLRKLRKSRHHTAARAEYALREPKV